MRILLDDCQEEEENEKTPLPEKEVAEYFNRVIPEYKQVWPEQAATVVPARESICANGTAIPLPCDR